MSQKGFIEFVSTLAKRDLDREEIPDWEQRVADILYIKDGKFSTSGYNTVDRLAFGVRSQPLWKVKKALEKLKRMPLSENSSLKLILPYVELYCLLMDDKIDFRLIKDIKKDEETRRHMVRFLTRLYRYLPNANSPEHEKEKIKQKMARGILFLLEKEDLFVDKEGKVRIEEGYWEHKSLRLSTIVTKGILRDTNKLKLAPRFKSVQERKEKKHQLIL